MASAVRNSQPKFGGKIDNIRHISELVAIIEHSQNGT